MRMGYILPLSLAVESNGVRMEEFLPPPLAVELNGVRMDDFSRSRLQ